MLVRREICQLKHWKTRRQRDRSFVSDSIRAASFAEERGPFTVSSRFVGFALEHWQMKGRFLELKKPAGKFVVRIWIHTCVIRRRIDGLLTGVSYCVFREKKYEERYMKYEV